MNAAMTARMVAESLNVHPDTVFKMARDGRIPGPIDSKLGSRLWRWSPVAIEEYIRGEWAPEAAS